MYSSVDTARRTAIAFPRIGSFLAQVQIEDDDDVRVEKTLGPDHFTIWGEPDLLVSRVVSTVPV